MYTVSIIFFLYVFGYLLRSKKRIQEKKRLRKLSRMQRGTSVMSLSASTVNNDDQTDMSSGTFKFRHPSSLSLENEMMAPSSGHPSSLNRFMDSIRGSQGPQGHQRRRFSRTDSNTSTTVISQNPQHPNKQFQWTPSSVSFSLVDESPTSSESAIAYAMNADSIIGDQQTGNHGNQHNKIKKMKVSDNEHSHGSFFLRAGAVGKSFFLKLN